MGGVPFAGDGPVRTVLTSVWIPGDGGRQVQLPVGHNNGRPRLHLRVRQGEPSSAGQRFHVKNKSSVHYTWRSKLMPSHCRISGCPTTGVPVRRNVRGQVRVVRPGPRPAGAPALHRRIVDQPGHRVRLQQPSHPDLRCERSRNYVIRLGRIWGGTVQVPEVRTRR